MSICKVAAWRVRGKVPLGADITASLTEAQMMDPTVLASRSAELAAGGHTHAVSAAASCGPQQQLAPLSGHSLRTQYALPIIRREHLGMLCQQEFTNLWAFHHIPS